MFSHGMYFCLPLLGVVLILRRVVSFLWVREKGMIVPLIYIGYLWRYGGGGGGSTGSLWNGTLEAETSLRRTAKDQPKDVKHL